MAKPITDPDVNTDTWLDVRLGDYRHKDEFESYRLGRGIVMRARDKGLKLRLVLSEATDILHPGLNPLLPRSYGVLSDEVYLCAEETIIHLRNGKKIRLPSRAQT
jgi:hypothetical protein